MSSLLKDLKLSSENPFDGLVPANNTLSGAVSLSEQRIIQEALKISTQIDFIFFRRFTDNIRSSQPVAYIIDNTKQKMSKDDIAHLHHTLWLNGTVPLLYVDNDNCVDVFTCVAGSVADNPNDWNYKPKYTILENSAKIADALKRFSAFNLANGFFWEDAQNKDYLDFKKSSYNVLIEKVKNADKAIDGENNPTARRLLILTLLIKYLEDRGVFNEASQFFSTYSNGATSFYEVLKSGTKKNILAMLFELETKFNGDVFSLPNTNELTKDVLKKVVDVVNAKKDAKGQLYFWNIFNFEHIPIEVLSHIYQYFTQKKAGAIFTPILLVNLMLDQIMPYATIKGNEKILDPTCGSGVFLVSAFRRLVYATTKKNKANLSPEQLTTLLKQTIFGVEFQEEAARIASFSLALAICDALRPEIIWKELKFEKIIERNIFVGDFAEVGEKALAAIKPSTGFDIIIGNPPFISELTVAMQSDLKKGEKIPDNQIAYYVLKRSAENYLIENGKLCLIQHYGFLYNSNTTLLRTNFFKNFTVSKTLDFISVNGLFYEAGTKAIALLLSKKPPENNHKIQHLTFRRTVSVKAHLCFELDYYDYHYVSMQDATDEQFSWKANLLGGGRLNQLAKRFRQYPTLESFISEKGWKVQEGFVIGKNGKSAQWLYEKPLLTSKILENAISNIECLPKTNSPLFYRSGNQAAYLSPLITILKRDSLLSYLWDVDFLAYSHDIVGINAPKNEKNELSLFFKKFTKNKNIYKALVYLARTCALTGRETAVNKIDIMNLPWNKNNNFELAEWEKELLNDITEYLADYVRKGQESTLLKTNASDNDLEKYSQTFLRIMNNVYPAMKMVTSKISENSAMIFFSFSDKIDNLTFLDRPDCIENLQSLITKEQSNSLRTQRIIRIFTGNSLIILKPAKLRYWIRSTAIRDVDDAIVYIMRGGK